MVSLVFKALRYLVAAAGGGAVAVSDDALMQAAGAVAVSDDALMQAAGALVTLGSLAISIYKDIRDARAQTAG